MKRNPSDEHPEDATLLAYLDAELPGAVTRTVLKHLQTCWKCRSSLAELEILAQTVSKLLSKQNESDMARTRAANVKFLQLKASLETKERPKARSLFFRRLPIDLGVRQYSHGLLLS